LAGCADADPVEACLEEHPPSAAPDVTQDHTKFGDGQDPADLGAIRQRCSEDGQPCATEPLLDRAGALCIARAQELPEGVAPWTAFFGHEPGHGGAVWIVCNTELTGVGGARGTRLVIDAVTGELLAREEWSVGA
jgi:hypothetical protein